MRWLATKDMGVPTVHEQGVVPAPRAVGLLNRRFFPTASAHESCRFLQGEGGDAEDDGVEPALKLVQLQRLRGALTTCG